MSLEEGVDMAVRRVRKRFCQDQLEVRIRSFCAMRDVVAFTLMSRAARIVAALQLGCEEMERE